MINTYYIINDEALWNKVDGIYLFLHPHPALVQTLGRYHPPIY